MEGIKTYKNNLDYEASLFDPYYQSDSVSSTKIISEFEYVYFLVETKETVLKNYRNYDLEYLNHLKKLEHVFIVVLKIIHLKQMPMKLVSNIYVNYIQLVICHYA